MMKIQHSVLGMCATNTYYVYDDETKRGLIVDPADSPDTIIAKADSLSMIPEAILITHGHFDHVLAMNKVREHYGIKVYAGLTEKQVLHEMAMNLRHLLAWDRYLMRIFISKTVKNLKQQDIISRQ